MRRTEYTAKWLAALREPDRKQAQGALCRVQDDGSKAFCCLGVGAEVTGDLVERADQYDGEANQLIWGVPVAQNDVSDEDNMAFGTLPPYVQEKLGITDKDQSALIGRNDNFGESFAQIADAIEAGLLHGYVSEHD